MNLKKITLTALLAAYSCGLPLQAMEIDPFKKTGIPTMDQHSTLVKLYATGIQKFINSSIGKTVMPWYRNINAALYNIFDNSASYKDASPEVQQLGKEAQEKLGIPPEQQVPIKLSGSFLSNYNSSAGIFIGDNSNNPTNRWILFHEAAHRKYWDPDIGLPEVILSFPLTYFIGTSIPKILQGLGLINECSEGIIAYSILASFGMFSYFLTKHQAFRESRAEYTTLHALDCYVCPTESSILQSSQDSERGKEERKLGYFCTEDVQKVTDELRKKNRLCAYHAQQQQNIIQKAW
ncbi:MAG: hypothetical protein AB7E68_04640 [Candidatus Babeliales bacterium]